MKRTQELSHKELFGLHIPYTESLAGRFETFETFETKRQTPSDAKQNPFHPNYRLCIAERDWKLAYLGSLEAILKMHN